MHSEAYVLDVPRVILGNDFLIKHKAIINYPKQVIQVRKHKIPFRLSSTEYINKIIHPADTTKVRLLHDVQLPPRKITYVNVQTQHQGLFVPSEKLLETHNILIADIYLDQVGNVKIPIVNPSKHLVKLNAHTSLGNVENVEVVSHLNYELVETSQLASDHSFCDKSSHLLFNVSTSSNQLLKFNINPNLTNEQKHLLLRVLMKFKDVFATSHEDAGLYNGPDLVRINTGNHPPISQPPYRKSHTERKIIKDHIDKLLKEGIIRPSTSEWASPVLLVSKPDGSVRLCIDYRKLNSIMKDDKFPMARLTDIFDSLYGAEYFSKLDINQGFYNFKLHPDDIEKSAFITNDGLYEFLRVPFGLRTSPACFNRLMRKIFGDILYSQCFLYVDDLLAYGKTFDDHLNSLENIFRKLLANNLKLKASKCSFGFTEVKLLGHIVSKKGIQVDPEKIRVIKELPTPKTITDVKSILGLAGFYRRFIDHFSDISRPLTNLTKKPRKFIWTQSCQRSFNLLKQKLTEAPILAQFNEQLPVILYVDASNYGLGAVLSQVQKNQEKVIAYASRLLTTPEINYATSEKEALALIFALDKFREYCYGRKITVYTDHMALLSLVKTKNSKNLRLARWGLAIQDADIEIKYKKGSDHLNADALSRIIPFPEKNISRL